MSTQNSQEKWTKQILHVWASSNHVASTLMTSYHDDVTEQLKSNTVVLVTVASSDRDIESIFYENKKRGRRMVGI